MKQLILSLCLFLPAAVADDLLIRDARIFDGISPKLTRGDVRVAENRIAEIGPKCSSSKTASS